MTHGSDESPQLSAHERQLLDALLDELIPENPEQKLPGAGALGLGKAVAEAFEGAPALLPFLRQGLSGLAEADFLSLPGDARVKRIQRMETELPGWVLTVMLYTCPAYYIEPRVMQAMGEEARAPHPLGYTLPDNDLSMLEKVRQRGKIYREV